MKTESEEFLRLAQLFKAMGYSTHPGEVQIKQLIKRWGINIAAEFQNGNGTTRLVTKEEFDRVVQKVKATEAAEAKAQATTEIVPESTSEILDRLDRIELALREQNRAISLQIEAINKLNDLTRHVAKDLGLVDTAKPAV